MARGHHGGGTDGHPYGARTDSETTHDGRPGRPGGVLTGPTEVPTPYGPALVDLDRPAGSVRSLLVLGLGAGGGVDAPGLLAVRDAALPASVAVTRATHAHRLARRRA